MRVKKWQMYVRMGISDIYLIPPCITNFTIPLISLIHHIHHVQANMTLRVHLWKKRQFRFIHLNNPVKIPLFLPSAVISSPRKTPFMTHFELYLLC